MKNKLKDLRRSILTHADPVIRNDQTVLALLDLCKAAIAFATKCMPPHKPIHASKKDKKK